MNPIAHDGQIPDKDDADAKDKDKDKKTEKVQSKKPADWLWDNNPRLPSAEQVLHSDDNWLNKIETDFVVSSVSRKSFKTRRNWWIASIVTLAISVAAVIAFIQWINAQKQLSSTISSLTNNSQDLFESNKEFDALLAGLKAGKLFIMATFGVTPEMGTRIEDALKDAVFWVKERNRLEGHKGAVHSISFSPDGRELASGSTDGTIKLWNVATGKVKTLEEKKFEVSAVSFSKDGLLASGSADGAITLWNVTDGGS